MRSSRMKSVCGDSPLSRQLSRGSNHARSLRDCGVSSRILRTEITRVLRREGLPATDRDQTLHYLDTIPLDHAVLQEAEAIIPHISSLDATVKSVATAMGFHVSAPVV